MAEKIELQQKSLVELLSKIIDENPGLTIGLMGVGTGWNPDRGEEGFEVRLSEELDDQTAPLFPTTYEGLSINYKKTGSVSLE